MSSTAVIDHPAPPKSSLPPADRGPLDGFGGGGGGGGDGDSNAFRGTSGPPFSIGRIGLMIVIGSIVMLFGGFLSVYVILRFSANAWPPKGALPLPKGLWISTAIIFLSHFTAAYWTKAGRAKNAQNAKKGLAGTFLLGAAFCATQAYLWRHLIDRGMAFNSSVYSANFYCITAVHFLHIVIGLVYMAVVLNLVAKTKITAAVTERLTNCAIYWHFVGLLWYVLFVAVCLV